MLTEYIRAAMRRATYEILSDGTFCGEIAGFQGVYANAETLEACREQLQEVLEGWIVLGLRMGHSLPVVEGVDLAVQFGRQLKMTCCSLDSLLMEVKT